MIRSSYWRALLLGVALTSGAAFADNPGTNRLQPMWGAIDPFWGAIDPFWGAIDPFGGTNKPAWGAIDPFGGTNSPAWGAIDPFSGANRPAWGAIDPFWGAIDPFWGAIDPFHSTLSSTSDALNPAYGRVSPFWGNTSLYWGKVNPFWGAIDPFSGSNTPAWGAIDPFWGAIDPFGGTNTPSWGAIDPFWGAIDPFWGAIDPFWKNVGPFWLNAGPQWGNIDAAWSQLQSTNATDYAALQQQLQTFIASAKAAWGAQYEQATNKTFMDGFVAPLLAKYGINPDDPSSLASVDANARSAFFMSLYDGLMGYSGMPRVDWWMAATHWTPLLTQIENPGTHTVIGILDSKFTDQSTNVAHLEFVGGYDYFVNDHGAAVASLLASQHTAGNVMGIAPNSPVLLYNPFDYTGTASWDDVAAGINALYARGASVINASLGVPGQVLSDEWATIMTSSAVNQTGHAFVLVKAAGNEGVVQTTDVNWIGSQAPNNLILVGSVGPTGMISSFSNTPGTACILVNGTCQQQNMLMYHFLVAPGENILVSDNSGGVMRVSGTSFAAPLVSGAVALLQDRWPWLKDHPDETTQIIFRSARDLGAPGVDPIYGWGELDIEASQSPLSFDNLTVLQPGTLPNGDYTYSATIPAATLKAAVLDPGQLNLWQQQGGYIIAFETIGATFRDFEIPLSSLLTGQNVNLGGENKPYQSYLYQRLIDWANAPGAASFNARANRFTNGEWSLSLTATQSSPEEMRHDTAPIHYEFAAVDRRTGFGLRFGEGSGAYSFTGVSGFSLRSDFDPATGGVNPVLGFASGGAYGQAEMTLGKARFSFGYTQKTDDHMYLDPTYGPVLEEKLAPNRAFASLFSVDYELVKSVKLNASFTNLRESDGLLGAQGAGLFNMVQGSNTAATTVGASFDLTGGWKLLASATTATSASPQFSNGALSFTTPHLNSTAYELVAMTSELFADRDSFRISLAQPLHIESGALQYRSMQVVDRETGELSNFTQTWNVSGKREYRMEALYGLPVLEGAAQLEGYALVDVNPHMSVTGAPELALGWSLRFALN